MRQRIHSTAIYLPDTVTLNPHISSSGPRSRIFSNDNYTQETKPEEAQMFHFTDLQAHWAWSLAAGLVLYSIAGMVYRVYFSPLSKFPGPKLAAATLFYEGYYDVIKQGQYTFKIRELHKKYGSSSFPSLENPLTRTRLQVQSSVSAHTNFTSTTQNTTRRSTHGIPQGTSTSTTQCNSAPQSQTSAP